MLAWSTDGGNQQRIRDAWSARLEQHESGKGLVEEVTGFV